MSEYVVSKFIPLPDVAPFPETCSTSSQHSCLHLRCLNICSPDNTEPFESTSEHEHRTDAGKMIAEGDKAFGKGYFREAIGHYTEMLKSFPEEKQFSASALAKRSGTYAMMACELRLRPVGACALYGMDAFGVAKLALKDSERVINLYPMHSEGYLRNAFALYLLEQYPKALDVCLEGIQWDFENTNLKECLQLIQAQLSGTLCPLVSRKSCQDSSSELQGQMTISEFECALCCKLFYKPVTAPCGHSFCMCCLERALDHSNKCPVCRTVIHVGLSLPISVTLNHIISSVFPKETEERRVEMVSMGVLEKEQDISYLPLFVLFTLFPGEYSSLNVFEPRYRLMTRRVMQGNRRFGMIQSCSQTSNGISRIGTECEIMECEPLADGRYFLNVVGCRRFEVLENWEQDGYRVVKAKYFQDDPNICGSQEYLAMETYARKIQTLAQFFKSRGLFHRQSGVSSDSWDKNEKDMEKISFLACGLLINHNGSHARRAYLETRSTLQRMEWILQQMGHYSSQ